MSGSEEKMDFEMDVCPAQSQDSTTVIFIKCGILLYSMIFIILEILGLVGSSSSNMGKNLKICEPKGQGKLPLDL